MAASLLRWMLGQDPPEGVHDDVPNGANNDGARAPSGQSTWQEGPRFRDVDHTRIAVKQYTCTSSGTQTIVRHTQDSHHDNVSNANTNNVHVHVTGAPENLANSQAPRPPFTNPTTGNGAGNGPPRRTFKDVLRMLFHENRRLRDENIRLAREKEDIVKATREKEDVARDLEWDMRRRNLEWILGSPVGRLPAGQSQLLDDQFGLVDDFSELPAYHPYPSFAEMGG